jgi:nitrite reductase (NADH) large subunit
MRTVIIGGGIAGVSCAEELRKLDPAAEITIVSEEHTPLYSRILLPHYVKGRVEREKVFLKSENWYTENNIEWLPGLRAEKIDHKNFFVLLSNGRELPFDKLVIAGGRNTRPLSDDRRGVAYLWTVDDADHLSQLLSEQEKPYPAAVYGGGLIGCEFIKIFQHYNLPTTVIFRGKSFWSRVLDEASGELINQHLKKQNIKIVPEANFVGLEGEKELAALITDKEKIDCKILGVGIGLEPDISWLADSGLKIEKGIVVNEKLETGLSGVYAIGDIAAVYDIHSGRHRVMATWLSAQLQGRIAAQNICGQNKVFDQVTSSIINVVGLDVVMLGDTSREWADKIKTSGGLEEGWATQVFYKKQKIIGATLINRNSERVQIQKAITEGILA